ncbi:alpha-ketoglutarate-dependent dioxygenase AlkB [Gordonia sp. DT30]|uniref:alpha-ketoglutarate-dependent dioxygenase AlkB n=1 Tax=unclassified Gordonia (in: high G+C Gram-positive bacteria) TaxID=2657482 RepID=UPI003CF14379
MTVGMQGSIFDFAESAGSDPAIGGLQSQITRRELSDGAWVDLRPGWISGSQTLFDALHDNAAWRAERRRMYDRVVDVPRLVATYRANATLPDPLLVQARSALTQHYRGELPEGFSTAGLCLYRDGTDSVAWHGDRFGRGATHDTMVAILSLGAPRPLTLRPRGGGPSLRFVLGSGDLLVMGGSCQRTWEHAVPKCAGVGARISVQFRPPGVW